MAISKIWDVKGSTSALYAIKNVVNYIKNSLKVTLNDESAITNVLDYSTNLAKTLDGETQLVTGLNCNVEFASEEFLAVQKDFNKVKDIAVFHAVQSFKPKEVDALTCHKIGIEFAQRMWGDRFQVVVSTHLDKEHLHNHFSINAVSFVDGKRFYDNKAHYHQMREVNDEICKEYGLSVIETPSQNYKGSKERSAETHGVTTERIRIANDVEYAIQQSTSMEEFFETLIGLNYEFKSDSRKKLKRIDYNGHYFNFNRLKNEEYSLENIEKRINENKLNNFPNEKTKKSEQEIEKEIQDDIDQLEEVRNDIDDDYMEQLINHVENTINTNDETKGEVDHDMDEDIVVRYEDEKYSKFKSSLNVVIQKQEIVFVRLKYKKMNPKVDMIKNHFKIFGMSYYAEVKDRYYRNAKYKEDVMKLRRLSLQTRLLYKHNIKSLSQLEKQIDIECKKLDELKKLRNKLYRQKNNKKPIPDLDIKIATVNYLISEQKLVIKLFNEVKNTNEEVKIKNQRKAKAIFRAKGSEFE